MHRVIQSYLAKFVEEHHVEGLTESEQFERFTNFCVFSQDYPDQFDIENVSAGDNADSIDGAAVLIDGDLVFTAEEAEVVFKRVRPKQQVDVTYAFNEAKRSEGFDAGEILKFGTAVADLLGTGKVADPILQEVAKIHELVVKNLARVRFGRPVCKLTYTTTGMWNEGNGLRKNLDQIKKQLEATGLLHSVSFEPVDRERLIKLWNETLAPIEATFPVKGYLAIPKIKGVEEAYVAIAPAGEFIKHVLSDEEGRIRAAVFEQNVRAYLGDDNAVNSSIREGIENADVHDRFAILNNGLTIVSPDVKVQNDRISVSGFQIVNGCQTSHVLHRNRDKVGPDVWLPIKVIEAQDPAIVSQVVQATNRQTDVDEVQFLSIRPYVQKLEAYFASFDTDDEKDRRLYIERRTRQYAGEDIGRGRIFDIQKLARAYAAMFLDLPHMAAGFPTMVAKQKADQLFQPDQREYAYYTAALALYRLELALGNQYVPRKYQSAKWHLLMAFRYQVGGEDMPGLANKKLDKYCEKLAATLQHGGKASAPPFLSGAKMIDGLGHMTRDRLKGQKVTDELRSALTGKPPKSS